MMQGEAYIGFEHKACVIFEILKLPGEQSQASTAEDERPRGVDTGHPR